MKKKAIAWMLFLAMTAALLGGCQMTDSSAPAPAAEPAAAAEVTEEAEEAGTEAAAEEEKDVTELDLFINFTWFPTEEWSGIIPEALTEGGGVRFNITRAADSSQLGVMIASGELPDVIFTKEVDRMCDPELCWGYDELIEKYNTGWQPPEEKIQIARGHNVNPDDEHYYTLKQNYSTAEDFAASPINTPNAVGTNYRRDIYEALGSPEMNTLEDYVKVLEMVKEQYPEMIPFGVGTSLDFINFEVYYDLEYDYAYETDGSVKLKYTLDRYQDYCRFVNELYRKGLFRAEDLAIDDADGTPLIYGGQVFSYAEMIRPSKLTAYQTELQKNVPDGVLAYMPIPDDAAEQIHWVNTGWAGVFISRNCKDPEAAIRMVEYLNSEEARHLALWGREGIDYTLDENGLPVWSEEWIETQADANLMTKKYNNNFYMCTTELDENTVYYSGISDEYLKDYNKNTDRFVIDPKLMLIAPNSTSDEGIAKAKIMEAVPAELVKVYTAATEEQFEEEYQNLQDLLVKMGVEELNAAATERMEALNN